MSQEHIQYKHDKHMPKQKTYKKENLNYIFFLTLKTTKSTIKLYVFYKKCKNGHFHCLVHLQIRYRVLKDKQRWIRKQHRFKTEHLSEESISKIRFFCSQTVKTYQLTTLT